MLSTIKCSSDKPIEFFPTTSQNNFTQDLQNLKRHIFFKKNLYSRKCFYGHAECRFDTLQKIFRPKAKKFRSMSKIDCKNFFVFPWKDSFSSDCFNGQVEFSWDNPAEKHFENGQKLVKIIRNWWKRK